MRLTQLKLVLASCVVFALGWRLAAQPPAGDQPVFRVSVTSVQIDVVVTDAKGRRVTDLTADDFEIEQDGQTRPIRTFRYEPAAAPTATPREPSPALAGAASGALPLSSPHLRPEHVRRAIAIVVDDLGLSFESTVRSREAIQRFIETLQPGDVATVVRSSAGVGMLQQFTSDKALLRAAADRVRYSMMSRYAADWGATLVNEAAERREMAAGRQVPRGPASELMRTAEEVADLRADTLALGTLGAVGFVARGMRDFPGRKALVLVTDGFSLYDPQDADQRMLAALQRLVETANRSSVVIHTVDAKGLQSLAPTAEARTAADAPTIGQLWDSQDGPGSIAVATGGMAIHNRNDIAEALGRVLEDQLGYYLIGFESDVDPPRSAPRFHGLRVRVKRPGLRVRARSGYFGMTDDEYARMNAAGSRLARALATPFTAEQLGVRITPIFRLDARGRLVVRALTHLDATGLTFEPQPEGGYTARFEIMAVAVDENGAVTSEQSQVFTARAKTLPTAAERADGFVHMVDVPIKSAGPYMFRVAVADTGSDRVGSAQQFVIVPEAGRRRLVLSDIALQQKASCPAADAACGGASLPADAGPALRRFTAPADVMVNFEVYHADPAARVESQIRLFQERGEAAVLLPQAIDLTPASRATPVAVTRVLRLAPTFPAGDYQVQVTVTERRPGKSPRTASRWTDFTVSPRGAPRQR